MSGPPLDPRPPLSPEEDAALFGCMRDGLFIFAFLVIASAIGRGLYWCWHGLQG